MLKKYIKNLLYKVYINTLGYYKPKHIKSITSVIDLYAKINHKVIFIQVGSNNGVNGDPIHKLIVDYRWRGILIEPVRYIYNQLIANYAGKNEYLIFENVAIAESDGHKKFYRLKENKDNLPQWYDQLGSFNKEVILNHKKFIPNIEDYLITEEIETVTFKTLLLKNSISSVNLIHIDTEGYDFEVIKLIDFSNVKPDIILFENKHLSNGDYKKCLKLLRKYGYTFYWNEGDTLCLQAELLKKIDVRISYY